LADEADRAYVHAGEGMPGYRAGMAHAPLRLVQGEWAAAPAPSEEIRMPATRVALWAGLGALARARGDTAAAWRLVHTTVPGGPAAEPGDATFPLAVEGQRLAAALALDDGDLPAARAWLAAHDRWLAWSGAVLWQAEGALGWAAYHRAAGDLAEARAQAERALALAAEPRQPLALLAARRLLAELDTGCGRHADAAAHLDAALALADACAAPYERALCLLARTELDLATGERERTGGTLTEVRALLVPLAAEPALARADALAARLAAPAPATAPAALPFGLTPREAEVLRLVAHGLGNAEVGARLFLSPRTVQQHLRSVYNKLGVDNRTAATRLAVEHRLA
jgi:DNA-binding CsgD family transcriptional regulator